MELISLVSIPINVAVLLFTAKGVEPNGEYGWSATVTYFMERDEGRTLFEVCLILVLIEHVLLGVKVVMATLIPDEPADVVQAERKRPKIEDIAEGEIHALKRTENLKDITELMDEIAKENLARNKAEIEREILEDQDRMEEVDPEARAAKLRKKAKITEDIQEIQEKAMA